MLDAATASQSRFWLLVVHSTITAIISGTKLLEVEDAECTSGEFGVLVCDGCVAVDRLDIGRV